MICAIQCMLYLVECIKTHKFVAAFNMTKSHDINYNLYWHFNQIVAFSMALIVSRTLLFIAFIFQICLSFFSSLWSIRISFLKKWLNEIYSNFNRNLLVWNEYRVAVDYGSNKNRKKKRIVAILNAIIDRS